MNSVGLGVQFQQTFCEDVSKLCVKTFNSLGKSGKPRNDEWTVLSCIVKSEFGKGTEFSLEVVALGTGSKCLGRSELPRMGDRLHDSHAEIIARRAFKFYILEQLKYSLEGKESIFFYNKGKKFTLKEHVSFHFFCSNMPCGDASIFPKELGCKDYAFKDVISHEIEEPVNKKRKINEVLGSKKLSSEGVFSTIGQIADRETETTFALPADLHRTGAKCVVSEACDPKEAGVNYHVTGVLRIKPGRGDQTLSHSCSDKMFRWTVLGVQGALPMLFLSQPIYLQTVIIGSCPFDRNAVQRALYTRFKEKLEGIEFIPPFFLQTPSIMQSKLQFSHAKPVLIPHESKLSDIRPSAASLIWSDTAFHRSKTEVSIDGKRLGTTKKNVDSHKSRVSICRMQLLRKTLDLLNCIQEKDQVLYSTCEGFSSAGILMSYADVKALSIPYQNMWEKFRKGVVVNWTKKPPHIKLFSLVQVEGKKLF